MEVCAIIDCGLEFPFLERKLRLEFANFGMPILLPILAYLLHYQFFP